MQIKLHNKRGYTVCHIQVLAKCIMHGEIFATIFVHVLYGGIYYYSIIVLPVKGVWWLSSLAIIYLNIVLNIKLYKIKNDASDVRKKVKILKILGNWVFIWQV